MIPYLFPGPDLIFRIGPGNEDMLDCVRARCGDTLAHAVCQEYELSNWTSHICCLFQPDYSLLEFNVSSESTVLKWPCSNPGQYAKFF